MIAAGTGILPFIDLLNLLLKKAIFLSLRSKGRDTSVVKPPQDYAGLFGGSHFKLLGAFRTLEDFIGHEWIDQLAKISRDEDLNLFECVARLKKGHNFNAVERTTSRFDKGFLKEIVMEGYDKIWLCATPEMHATLYQTLTSLGVEKSKIHFI